MGDFGTAEAVPFQNRFMQPAPGRISKVVPSVDFSILQGLEPGIICWHCAGVKTPASLRSLAFVARLKPCPDSQPDPDRIFHQALKPFPFKASFAQPLLAVGRPGQLVERPHPDITHGNLAWLAFDLESDKSRLVIY